MRRTTSDGKCIEFIDSATRLTRMRNDATDLVIDIYSFARCLWHAHERRFHHRNPFCCGRANAVGGEYLVNEVGKPLSYFACAAKNDAEAKSDMKKKVRFGVPKSLRGIAAVSNSA